MASTDPEQTIECGGTKTNKCYSIDKLLKKQPNIYATFPLHVPEEVTDYNWCSKRGFSHILHNNSLEDKNIVESALTILGSDLKLGTPSPSSSLAASDMFRVNPNGTIESCNNQFITLDNMFTHNSNLTVTPDADKAVKFFFRKDGIAGASLDQSNYIFGTGLNRCNYIDSGSKTLKNNDCPSDWNMNNLFIFKHTKGVEDNSLLDFRPSLLVTKKTAGGEFPICLKKVLKAGSTTNYGLKYDYCPLFQIREDTLRGNVLKNFANIPDEYLFTTENGFTINWRSANIATEPQRITGSRSNKRIDGLVTSPGLQCINGNTDTGATIQNCTDENKAFMIVNGRIYLSGITPGRVKEDACLGTDFAHGGNNSQAGPGFLKAVDCNSPGVSEFTAYEKDGGVSPSSLTKSENFSRKHVKTDRGSLLRVLDNKIYFYQDYLDANNDPNNSTFWDYDTNSNVLKNSGSVYKTAEVKDGKVVYYDSAISIPTSAKWEIVELSNGLFKIRSLYDLSSCLSISATDPSAAALSACETATTYSIADPTNPWKIGTTFENKQLKTDEGYLLQSLNNNVTLVDTKTYVYSSTDKSTIWDYDSTKNILKRDDTNNMTFLFDNDNNIKWYDSAITAEGTNAQWKLINQGSDKYKIQSVKDPSGCLSKTTPLKLVKCDKSDAANFTATVPADPYTGSTVNAFENKRIMSNQYGSILQADNSSLYFSPNNIYKYTVNWTYEPTKNIIRRSDSKHISFGLTNENKVVYTDVSIDEKAHTMQWRLIKNVPDDGTFKIQSVKDPYSCLSSLSSQAPLSVGPCYSAPIFKLDDSVVTELGSFNDKQIRYQNGLILKLHGNTHLTSPTEYNEMTKFNYNSSNYILSQNRGVNNDIVLAVDGNGYPAPSSYTTDSSAQWKFIKQPNSINYKIQNVKDPNSCMTSKDGTNITTADCRDSKTGVFQVVTNDKTY